MGGAGNIKRLYIISESFLYIHTVLRFDNLFLTHAFEHFNHDRFERAILLDASHLSYTVLG